MVHPRVRQLYKSFLWMAKDYPEGSAIFRRKLKDAFLRNAAVSVQDEDALNRCISRGEYVIKELEALAFLHKYRTMRKRYEDTDMSDAATFDPAEVDAAKAMTSNAAKQ